MTPLMLLVCVWPAVAPFRIDYGGPAVTPETAQTNEVVTGVVLVVLVVTSLLMLLRIRRTTPEDAR